MLVLLDIDGVMVPAKLWRKPELLKDGFAEFSMRAVRALQKVIYETDATLLLTTSHKSNYSIDQWRNIFRVRGILVGNINWLSENDDYLNRKDEILDWHRLSHNANENFVIIDDDKMLSGLPDNIKENLVLTSSSVGLTDELADKAISILKRKISL
jgi:hypothetical protein